MHDLDPHTQRGIDDHADLIRAGLMPPSGDAHIAAVLSYVKRIEPTDDVDLTMLNLRSGSVLNALATAQLTAKERQRALRRWYRRTAVNSRREAFEYLREARRRGRTAHALACRREAAALWSHAEAFERGAGRATDAIPQTARTDTRSRGAGRPAARSTRSSKASGDSGDSDGEPPARGAAHRVALHRLTTGADLLEREEATR